MQHWLLKTEPDEFPWADLRAAGKPGETWDGIRNHQAAGFLRQMRRRDQAFIYHTGKERRIVGIGEIVGEHFPDASDESGRFIAVRVRALAPLARPVTLDEMKADRVFAACLLLRQSRLSAMPISAHEWQRVLALAAT